MGDTVIAAVTQKSAIFFALKFGFSISAGLAILEITVALLQKKLHIRESEPLKHSVLMSVVLLALLGLFVAGLSLFAPPYVVRSEIFERNFNAIDHVLFFGIQFFSMLLLFVPVRFLTKRFSEKEDTTAR
ncbi:MAG: hypothetical protein AAFP07_22125 [Cyanobacteria bacterium J06606_4]